MRCAITSLAFCLGLAAQDRLPPIPTDQMTDVQKKTAAEYKDLRKADLAGPPWSVMLRSPDWVVPALEMRLHVQNKPVLGNRLTEFAILIAAREWTNNYEWNAHSPAAGRAGLSASLTADVAA